MKWFATLFLVAWMAVPVAAQDSAVAKSKFRRQPNVIVMEEIDAIRNEATTALAIVQRLRPNFLRTRGATSFGNARGGRTPVAQVVVDGAPRGDVTALSQIPAAAVREIRYLNAADATIQFGTGYDGGAILVFTR